VDATNHTYLVVSTWGAAAVVATAVVGAVRWIVRWFTGRMDSQDTAIATIDQSVSSIHHAIDRIAEKVAEVVARQEREFGGNSKGIREAVNTIRDDVVSVKSDVADVRTDVSGVKIDVGTLRGRFDQYVDDQKGHTHGA
jgi:archaellum component FlaC